MSHHPTVSAPKQIVTMSLRFYVGKKVVFIYRAKKEIRGSKIRCIWGKIRRTHGMPDCIRRSSHKALTDTIQVTPVLCAQTSEATSHQRHLEPH